MISNELIIHRDMTNYKYDLQPKTIPIPLRIVTTKGTGVNKMWNDSKEKNNSANINQYNCLWLHRIIDTTKRQTLSYWLLVYIIFNEIGIFATINKLHTDDALFWIYLHCECQKPLMYRNRNSCKNITTIFIYFYVKLTKLKTRLIHQCISAYKNMYTWIFIHIFWKCT